MTDLNIGGHLSLGRNPVATVEQAARDGFRSMQIFASSPGAWKPPVLTSQHTALFPRAREENGVNPLFIHAIYLINLASPRPDLVRRSVQSLRATLAAGSAMGAFGVITHIGSHGGQGFDAVADGVASGLLEILAEGPEDILLILENSAGAGGIIGSQIPELATLLERADGHPRLRIALDTAHLTGSGWDFRSPGEASRLADEVKRLIGLDRLSVIHANDSAVPVGSRRDRHANIGEGHIGAEGFAHLLAEPRLRSVPWVMETPDLSEREPGKPTPSLLRLRELAGTPAKADGGK